METTFSDVLKLISRFKREDKYSWAVLMLQGTYHKDGPKAAMAHARRIAAAYRNVRAHRTESRTQALRTQAERQGLRYV